MNDAHNAAIVASVGLNPAFEADMTFTDTLEVEAEYVRGFPGSRETPAEPGGYFPSRVFWRGIEITHVLDTSEMDDIAEKINAR